MSFEQVLEELPALTLRQRQILMRRALELEDQPLSVEHESIVEARLAAHRKNPASSLSLDEFKKRLRRRRAK
jgi:hypothetical protein